MNLNLIAYFEEVKLGGSHNIDHFLAKDEKDLILNWYNGNVNKTGTIDTALNFMYELYIRENLDIYEVEEFQRVVQSLSNKYGFDIKQIFSILNSYRVFIYR